MSNARTLAGIFRALSVETRLRIVLLLKERPLCVNALAARLGVTPAAVSQHLRVLAGAGLVRGRRQGYYVHYEIRKATLRRWRELAGKLLRQDGE
jgi:DNA-binding transcriptional ArsR family regulator